MVVGSAVAFSAKAVIAEVGYRHGADPATLLALRMAFSFPFFVVAALVTSRRGPPLARGELAKIVVLGVLGYYRASVLDFYGLVHISAGLATDLVRVSDIGGREVSHPVQDAHHAPHALGPGSRMVACSWP